MTTPAQPSEQSQRQAYRYFAESVMSLDLLDGLPDAQRPETVMKALVFATLSLAACFGGGEEPPPPMGTAGATFS